MIVLVSGATRYPRDEKVGHLIVPRQWNTEDSLDLQPGRWAMDNGGFIGFDEGAFVRMLEEFAHIDGCLFAAAPDKVGDFAATLKRWGFWSRLIRGLRLPVAFVAQDGLQPYRMPWDELDALFVGGTDAYKESAEAASLMGYAKALGKWVHVGRVNGRRRYALMLKSGADSIDGTGFSMYPDANIPKAEQWRTRTLQQPALIE